MKYSPTQIATIKGSFTESDRKKLKRYFDVTSPGTDRLIVNGLRRVSLKRAQKIAKIIGRPDIIKVLLPDIADVFKTA